MGARLATELFIQALRRSAEAAGGNCSVIARGDPVAGTLILICANRGVQGALLELSYDLNGQLEWRALRGPTQADDLQDYLESRRRTDPDLWTVELDIPASERFAADFIGQS